jgi:hypothetical protein
MTPECRELEVLRSIHASGGLEGDEAARVVAHLEACAGCREADRRDRELLGLVRLPPPTPAEELAVADLPGRTLRALQRRERRGTWARRLGAVAGIAAVAAALVLMLLWPALGRRPLVPGAAPAVSIASAESVPEDGSAPFFDEDVDDDGASSSSTATDIALAAYDAGVGN